MQKPRRASRLQPPNARKRAQAGARFLAETGRCPTMRRREGGRGGAPRGRLHDEHRRGQHHHEHDAGDHDHLHHPLEHGGVLHLRQREARQHGAVQRRDDGHEAVGGHVDHDHDLGREAQAVRQRPHDGHRQRGHAGARGDGERQHEVEQERGGREDEGGHAGQRVRGVREDERVKLRLAHDDGDGARKRDDERDADHLGAAAEERLHDVLAREAREDADDDGHEQEPRRGLVEVPHAQRHAGEHRAPGARRVVDRAAGHEDVDAEVLPRYEADDHDDEREREQHEHDLLLAGEDGRERRVLRILLHLAVLLLGLLLLLQRQERGAFVGLDLLGVAHDEEDGDGLGDDEQHEPEADDDALVDGDAHVGEGGGGHADGERVHRGADAARARAQQHHERAGERVEARGVHGGGQQDVERHRLLHHAVGGAADAEQQHEDGDEDELAALEGAYERGDAGVERAGLVHHGQKAAQHEHEHAHLHGAREAEHRGGQNVGERRSGYLAREERHRHGDERHDDQARHEDDEGEEKADYSHSWSQAFER